MKKFFITFCCLGAKSIQMQSYFLLLLKSCSLKALATLTEILICYV